MKTEESSFTGEIKPALKLEMEVKVKKEPRKMLSEFFYKYQKEKIKEIKNKEEIADSNANIKKLK